MPVVVKGWESPQAIRSQLLSTTELRRKAGNMGVRHLALERIHQLNSIRVNINRRVMWLFQSTHQREVLLILPCPKLTSVFHPSCRVTIQRDAAVRTPSPKELGSAHDVRHPNVSHASFHDSEKWF